MPETVWATNLDGKNRIQGNIIPNTGVPKVNIEGDEDAKVSLQTVVYRSLLVLSAHSTSLDATNTIAGPQLSLFIYFGPNINIIAIMSIEILTAKKHQTRDQTSLRQIINELHIADILY